MLIVAFLECIQLAVVGATIDIDFALPVLLESTLHLPFAINETTVPDHEQFGSATTRTPEVARRFFGFEVKDVVAPVDYHEFVVGWTVILGLLVECAN